ncbi:MAG TPA: diaminopimelate decarboxylase, partial [Clostridiales bacterium]|nr:diaminopimelate decarboxylase [Clostridiales bacterium]
MTKEKALLKANKSAFYVFDIQTLRERIAYLKAALPAETELCYAVKANTFIVPNIKDMVSRLEICSPGEALICEKAEVPEEKMVISGVYKDPAVMEDMIKQFDGRIYTV